MIESSELVMSSGLRLQFDHRRDTVVVIPKFEQPYRVTLDEFEYAIKLSIAKRKQLSSGDGI